MDIASWTPRCNSHCGGRYTRIQHSIAFNWLSSYCCLGSRDLWHGTKRAYKPQNPPAWKIEKLCRHTVRIAFKVQHHESLVLQSLAHCFFCGLPRPQNTSFISIASFCLSTGALVILVYGYIPPVFLIFYFRSPRPCDCTFMIL